MQGEQEVFFTCPYCAENISMVFELYYGKQSYIEDCEVCCCPIQIQYNSDGENISLDQINRADWPLARQC